MSGTKSGGGPESDFLNTLKKKQVALTMSEGPILEGELIWVDTFSYGLRTHSGDVMVSKHSVVTIRLA